jgi:hypothetical protein
MASVAKGDSGLALGSPENSAGIGLDWTMCGASSWMTHSTAWGPEAFLQLFGDLS